MRYTCLLLLLAGCGGAEFTATDTSGATGAGGDAATGSSNASAGGDDTSTASTATTGVGGSGSTSGPSTTSTGTTTTTGSGGCAPSSCEDLGKNCGPVADGCGAQLDCGNCAVGFLCGGDGVPNVCGGCVPKTCESLGVNCGEVLDGCGNTLDCGAYEGYPICDYLHMPEYSCKCPGLNPYAWRCENGLPANSPPPFAAGCVANPQDEDHGWCCTTMVP